MKANEVALVHVQIEALQDLNLLANPPVGLIEARLDQGRGIPLVLTLTMFCSLRGRNKEKRKSKGKTQKSKVKTEALTATTRKAFMDSYFCILPFAFCL